MIEPLDGAVELGALLLPSAALPCSAIVSANCARSSSSIEVGDVGEHGQALLRDFGETAEHDDLLMRAASGDGQNSRTDRRHDAAHGRQARRNHPRRRERRPDRLRRRRRAFQARRDRNGKWPWYLEFSVVTRGLTQRVHRVKSVAYRWIAGSRPAMTQLLTPLRPRASCPSRRPLRWCRPCRRPLPADDRTCLRRFRGSP